MKKKTTLMMSKKITILLLVSLFILLVFYAQKPTIIKDKDLIQSSSYFWKKDWYQYYLMSNPPSDTIECHWLILKYVDDLGISLDSLKKTDIGAYTIWFYKYTLWGKIYHLFTGEYSYKSSNYLGGVTMIKCYEDTTKWRMYFDWYVEDEDFMPDGYRPYVLYLIDEYSTYGVNRDRDDSRAVYYRELQAQKKQKP